MNIKLQNIQWFHGKKFFTPKYIICTLAAILLCVAIIFQLVPKNKNTKLYQNDTQYQFDTYANELFAGQIMSDSLSMHFYLLNPQDFDIEDAPQTLGDYNYESMSQSQQYYINEINNLKTFKYNDLLTEQQITYDILMAHFKDQLDFADLCLCSEVLSPTTGLQAQLPILFAEYTFFSKKDIDNYLTLLWKLKDYYSQICEFQKIKAENNCFITDFCCEKIIKQCREFIGDKNSENNLLHKSFVQKINALSFLSKNEKATYINENLKIIKESVFPAYDSIITTLTKLKAEGHCKNKNGLYYLDNGKDYYEYLTRNYTGSSQSIMEIKSDIQNNLAHDMRTMYSLLTVNPELEEQFYSDVKNPMDAAEIIKDLQKKSSKDFPEICGSEKLSDISYELKYVDKSLEDFLSPAFYLSPPIDMPSQNVIYINGSEKNKKQDIYSTLAHEGIPGHMYQSWYFSCTNPLPIRQIINYGGYTEGWATYVEFLSYYYQYSNEQLANAMSCSASYSLALYSLCDIGINYEGWTQKDTEKFLSNYNIEDKKVCETIFQSVIEEPANYLKYYVGYIEILNLKNKMQKKLETQFDLKRFHKAFLSIGPASFDVINKWIMYEYAK